MAFKASSGHYYFNALFYEETLADKSTVVYTLKRHDHEGYPSLYRLYMEMDDVSEYSFATTYLDGWEHWTKLCECNWFKPHVAKWRKELEVRTQARALEAIRQTANDPEAKERYQANKFLVNGGWKDKTNKHGRGRPSKDAIKTEAQKIAQERQELDADFERVMN